MEKTDNDAADKAMDREVIISAFKFRLKEKVKALKNTYHPDGHLMVSLEQTLKLIDETN